MLPQYLHFQETTVQNVREKDVQFENHDTQVAVHIPPD